jgi:myo-inositol 2-dehydrogenase / D-chiro-inositol 1-dehydrogenase
VKRSSFNRRSFLQGSAGAVAAGLTTPYWLTSATRAAESKNDRPTLAAIGVANKGLPDAIEAAKHADIVAICDVDRGHAENAQNKLNSKAELYEDYRRVLDRKDVDAVLVVTPDHWHTKIAIDAMRAGKDLYLEKPMTLTVDEGKQLRKVVKETGRVMQIGSQQRSDERFRTACELVRNGRLGKIQEVTVGIVAGRPGGPFENKPVPTGLNWEMWLGQAPLVEFCPERCHYTFRFWFEYSGGQMTNWGAHHMDIAHWGLDMDNAGPVSVQGHAELPQLKNGYNVPTSCTVDYLYPNDVKLQIVTSGAGGGNGASGGVTFKGDKGEIHVDRRSLTGAPADELKENPFPADAIRLYKSDNHMANFFDCLKSRKQPVSAVESQHRTCTACHIGNISMRLGRKLNWDSQKEEFVGDSEANAMLRREQRKGYETA